MNRHSTALVDTSTRGRPALAVRRHRLRLVRPGPFRLLLLSGVLAAGGIAAMAWSGAWSGRAHGWQLDVATAGACAPTLALVLLVVGVPWAVRAWRNAPDDTMSHYGGGRRVELAWKDRYATTGVLTVEGRPIARVSTGRDIGGLRAMPLSVSGPTGLRLSRTSDGPTTPGRYTVRDRDGEVVTVRGDHGPGLRVDWTATDRTGATLRWRHHRLAGRVARVTLVDDQGTAWWVERHGRNRVRAELPDGLDDATAHTVVLLVDDQVERARRAQETAYGG